MHFKNFKSYLTCGRWNSNLTFKTSMNLQTTKMTTSIATQTVAVDDMQPKMRTRVDARILFNSMTRSAMDSVKAYCIANKIKERNLTIDQWISIIKNILITYGVSDKKVIWNLFINILATRSCINNGHWEFGVDPLSFTLDDYNDTYSQAYLRQFDNLMKMIKNHVRTIEINNKSLTTLFVETMPIISGRHTNNKSFNYILYIGITAALFESFTLNDEHQVRSRIVFEPNANEEFESLFEFPIDINDSCTVVYNFTKGHFRDIPNFRQIMNKIFDLHADPSIIYREVCPYEKLASYFMKFHCLFQYDMEHSILSWYEKFNLTDSFTLEFALEQWRSDHYLSSEEYNDLDIQLMRLGIFNYHDIHKTFPKTSVFHLFFNWYLNSVAHYLMRETEVSKQFVDKFSRSNLKRAAWRGIKFHDDRYFTILGYYVLETMLASYYNNQRRNYINDPENYFFGKTEIVKPIFTKKNLSDSMENVAYDENMMRRVGNAIVGNNNIQKMAEKVTETTESVRATADTAEEFFKTAKKAIDDLQCDAKKMKEVVEQTVNNISNQYGWSKMLIFFGKWASYAYLVSQSHNRTFANIATLTVLVLPEELVNIGVISGTLSRAVSGAIERINGPNLRRWDGKSENLNMYEPNVDNDDNKNIIECLWEIIKYSIMGWFDSDVAAKLKEVTISARKVKIVSDTISSIKNIYGFLVTAFTKILDIARNIILKLYGIVPSWLKEEPLTQAIDKFTAMRKNGTFEEAKIKQSAATEVKNLRLELIDLESTLNKSLAQNNSLRRFAVLPYISFMMKEIENIWNAIPPQMRSDTMRGRPRPFNLWLHGKVGLGKSSVVQPYLINRICRAAGIIKEFDDPDNYSFFRDPAVKFWEGYTGQPVVQYNDVFQTISDDEALNSSIREFTSINDDIIFPLDMAFGDKGKCYFTSPIVVYNAQGDIIGAQWITDKCWSKAEHLYRRRHVVAQLILNPKYAKPNGELDMDIVARELGTGAPCYGDPSDPLFLKDQYGFIFTNPSTGIEELRCNFEFGCQYIEKMADKVVNHGKSLKEKLVKAMAYEWLDHGDNQVSKANFVTNPNPSLGFVYHPNALTDETENSDVESNYEDTETRYDLGDNHIKCVCTTILNLATTLEILKWHNIEPNQLKAFIVDRKIKAHITSGNIHGLLHEYYRLVLNNVNGITNCSCPLEIEKLQANHYIPGKYREAIQQFTKPHSRCYSETTTPTMFEFLLNDEEVDPELSFIDKWSQMAKQRVQQLIDHFKKIVKDNMFYIVAGVLCGGLSMVATYMQYRKEKEIGNDCDDSLCDINVDDEKWIYELRKKYDKQLEANTAEGNIKPKKRQIITKESAKAYIANEYNQTNVDIENKVKSNFVILSGEVYDNSGKAIDVGMTGVALCLGGDIFVSPKHYFNRFAQYHKFYQGQGDNFTIRLKWSKNSTTTISYEAIDLYKSDSTDDVIFFRIKDHCNMPNISKFFIKQTDEPNLHGGYLWGPRLKEQNNSDLVLSMSLIPVSKIHLRSVTYKSKDVIDRKYGTVIKGSVYELPKCYEYSDSIASVGDCGMVLMHVDNKFSSRNLLGLHVAGAAAVNMGISNYITQEIINQVFDHYKSIEPIPMRDPISVDANGKPDKLGEALTTNGLEVLGVMSKIEVNGTSIQPRTMLPMGTKITKSVVYDQMEEIYGETNMYPANLRPYTTEFNVRVKPFENAVKKLTAFSRMFDQNTVRKIETHIINTIASWPSKYNEGDSRILTDFEAVNGYGLIKPIDMTTSPGFPYVQMGLKKTDLFTKVEVDGNTYYEMTDMLKTHVENMEIRLKKGEIPDIIWCDSLKDETRPQEKVDKPRIFNVGPLPHLILMRKYMGWWVNHMYSSYLHGETAVGVNPNSKEWTIKIKQMLDNGDCFINGDFKWYDSTLVFQFARIQANIINAFYNDLYAAVRIGLIFAAMFSYHLIGNLLVLIRQGNPSGWFLTTLINIIANMFFTRYAFMETTGLTLADYEGFIKAWFFGDDNLISVHDFVKDKMNMHTFISVLKEVGMTYTSPDKREDNDIPLHYTIDEITFLKRRFHKDGDLYLAQLEKNVIQHIPRWSESDPNNMKDQMNRFNSSLYEMSNYPKEEFEQMRETFTQMVIELGRRGYDIKANDLFTYEWCKSNMYVDEYVNTDLLSRLEQVQFYETNGEEIKRLCQVCKENKVMSIFYPCNHAACCLFCAINITNCPLCDRTIEETWRNDIAYEPNADEGKTDYSQAAFMVVSIILTRCLLMFHGTIEDIIDWIIKCLLSVKSKAKKKSLIPMTVKYKPNADEEEAEISKQTNVIFDESSTTHAEYENSFKIPSASDKLDIAYFMTKPYNVATFKWAPGDARWKVLATLDLPTSLINISSLRYKLDSIGSLRCDCEITVRLNGTPFHYGRLICWSVYAPYAQPTEVYEPRSASTTDFNCISASGQTELVITVPFKWIANWMPYTRSGNYAKFQIAVLHPLLALNGTAASLNGTCFMRLRNISTQGLSGYNIVTENDEEKYEPNAIEGDPESQRMADKDTNISSGSTKTSKVMSWIGKIGKLVGVSLGAFGGAFSAISHVISFLGYSVPPDLRPNTMVQSRNQIHGKTEELATSITMACKHDAFVTNQMQYVEGREEELSILYNCQRPALWLIGTIVAADAAGKNIFSRLLTPKNFFLIENDTVDLKKVYYTPLAYVSRAFRNWRGSLKFTVSFICTNYHTCRVRIWFEQNSTLATLPDYRQVLVPNLIVDIEGDTDVTFIVPMLSVTPWLMNNDDNTVVTKDADPKYSNGSLNMSIINPISSGQSAPTAIYYQVFVSAGQDYQLSGPSPQILSTGVVPTIYEPNADESCKTTKFLPSMSSKDLRRCEAIMITGNDKGFRDHKTYASEEISSIKEIYNMSSAFDKFYVEDDKNETAICVNPYSADLRWRGPGYVYQHMHLMTYFMKMFTFWRGSWRVQAEVIDNTKACEFTEVCTKEVGNLPDGTTTLVRLLVSNTKYTFFEPGRFLYKTYHRFVRDQPIDFTIPWSNIYRCQPIVPSNKPAANVTWMGGNVMAFLAPYPSNFKMVVFISGGDDFVTGCLRPIPMMDATTSIDEEAGEIVTPYTEEQIYAGTTATSDDTNDYSNIEDYTQFDQRNSSMLESMVSNFTAKMLSRNR